jgi:hypothetical protein
MQPQTACRACGIASSACDMSIALPQRVAAVKHKMPTASRKACLLASFQKQ